MSLFNSKIFKTTKFSRIMQSRFSNSEFTVSIGKTSILVFFYVCIQYCFTLFFKCGQPWPRAYVLRNKLMSQHLIEVQIHTIASISACSLQPNKASGDHDLPCPQIPPWSGHIGETGGFHQGK